jgi:hypothetical protein
MTRFGSPTRQAAEDWLTHSVFIVMIATMTMAAMKEPSRITLVLRVIPYFGGWD